MGSEWANLLTNFRRTNGAETVPDGWKTRLQIEKELGMGNTAARSMMRSCIRAGVVESKKFRIFDGNKVMPIPHYRIISKTACQPKKKSIQRHD